MNTGEMAGRFSFIAQSLDNSSPDTASTRGHLLDMTDERSPGVVKLFDRTTLISSRGRQKTDPATGSRAFVYGNEVLFEIASLDQDIAGRRSPIMCVGELPMSQEREQIDTWIRSLLEELQEFAAEADRKLSGRQVHGLGQFARAILQSGTPGQSLKTVLSRPVAAVMKAAQVIAPDNVEARLGSNDYEVLPDAPSKRRIVLVLSSADRRQIIADRKRRETVSAPDVAILSEPESGGSDLPKLDSALYRRGLLRAGSALIQNPYDPDEYFSVATAAEDAVHAYVRAFIQICRLLGAVSVEVISAQRYDARVSVQKSHEGAVQGGVGAEHSRSDEAIAQLQNEIQYRESGKGPARQVSKAWEYARAKQLDRDRELGYILDAVTERGDSLEKLQVSINTGEALESVRSRVSRVDSDLGSVLVRRGDIVGTVVRTIFTCEVTFRAGEVR